MLVVTTIAYPALEADPPALRHGERLIVKRISELLQAAIRAPWPLRPAAIRATR